MSKQIWVILSFLLCMVSSKKLIAQESIPGKTYKVAIVAPLYLDSLFKGTYYRYGTKFPKFALAGIEFVQGAQVALDSMPQPSSPIEASVFDSESESQSVASLLDAQKLDSFDLVIGYVRDQDYMKLALFSAEKQVPFISASYPNDGGITSNPFLVILNSTLRAHCESIYSFLLQNHDTSNIVFCRQPGSQEDRVHRYFTEINTPDGNTLMEYKSTIILDSNFNSIKYKLDSTKQNVVVAESLDEYFAHQLATACSALSKTYRIKLIGMPNWDGFKSFTKKNGLKDFPVYYTSPYYNPHWDAYSKSLKALYLKKYKGNPTEFSYKGFEAICVFIPILLAHPNDFTSHLNDFKKKVFTDFIFRPVINSSTGLPDYFENKHMYFMQIKDGNISRAW